MSDVKKLQTKKKDKGETEGFYTSNDMCSRVLHAAISIINSLIRSSMLILLTQVTFGSNICPCVLLASKCISIQSKLCHHCHYLSSTWLYVKSVAFKQKRCSVAHHRTLHFFYRCWWCCLALNAFLLHGEHEVCSLCCP